MAKKIVATATTDKIVDDLIKRVTAAPAQLTCEQMDQIETRWRDDMRARRCALVMLTKSGKDYMKMTEKDREFAKAVAGVRQYLPELIAFHKCMIELFEQMDTWSIVALAGREDMRELLDTAKAEFDAPAAPGATA